jgi:hypothetical protein
MIIFSFYFSDKMELMKESRQDLNVNEEYLGALRTKSYAEFLTKAQSLVNEPSSLNFCHQRFSEILLEPRQESVKSLLESAAFLSRKSDLKALLFNYFDISAEAAKICSHLLRSINELQSNQQLINQICETIDDHSPDQLHFIVSELRSIILHNNPLSDLNQNDFIRIHDKYSSTLQHLKSKRKSVARRIKLIKCFNKASGVCVTAACGVIAVAAMVLAAHTLAALVMGPALFSLPMKPFKKKFLSIRFLKCGLLRKVGDQLDVAAKGTYILNRDFDTMSRLITRLHDEIEHNREMIKLCLDRREDRFSLQILKELKKSDFGCR